MPQVLKFLRGVIKATSRLFFYKAMYHPSYLMRCSRTSLLLALFHLEKKKRKKKRPKNTLLKVEVTSQDREDLEDRGQDGRRCSRRKEEGGRMKRERGMERMQKAQRVAEAWKRSCDLPRPHQQLLAEQSFYL